MCFDTYTKLFRWPTGRLIGKAVDLLVYRFTYWLLGIFGVSVNLLGLWSTGVLSLQCNVLPHNYLYRLPTNRIFYSSSCYFKWCPHNTLAVFWPWTVGLVLLRALGHLPVSMTAGPARSGCRGQFTTDICTWRSISTIIIIGMIVHRALITELDSSCSGSDQCIQHCNYKLQLLNWWLIHPLWQPGV